MGIKLIWTGIILMLAVNQAIETFGGRGSDILVVVGAIFAVIGLVILWLDR